MGSYGSLSPGTKPENRIGGSMAKKLYEAPRLWTWGEYGWFTRLIHRPWYK